MSTNAAKSCKSSSGPVINQYVSGLDKGSGLYFHFVKPETTTPGGLPARTGITSFLKSDHFRRRPYDPHRGSTSPTAAVLCDDTFQSMYAQMLCGLRYRDAVLCVGAAFAYGLVRAVSFLQQNWRQLAADIEAGAVALLVTDPAVREALAGVLRLADPELARFIRTECASSEAPGGDGWAGILARMWPKAKYLEAITTGSMAQYVPTLDHYSGGLPIVSTIYVSSECHFGINLQPMCKPSEVAYTIMPTMAYFEFLPVDTGPDATASQLVELARVEAGRDYELVVTTYGGLCRYRVGDVVRVVGFHNAAPRLRFVRRGNVVLSIDADKTDEAELQRAVERASAALLRPRGVAVLDYTSRTCTDRVPGHYVVYWELLVTDNMVDGGQVLELDRCCLEMEEALSSVYREAWVALGSIGPLEIRVVRPGTFEELADYAIAHGGSVGQYKVPRCVTAPAMVQLLHSSVVSSHISPALPHWAPRRHFE